MRRGEQRGDAMPGGMGARMPVQEQHGWAGAAMPHPQRDVVQRDLFQGESVEHGGRDVRDARGKPHARAHAIAGCHGAIDHVV